MSSGIWTFRFSRRSQNFSMDVPRMARLSAPATSANIFWWLPAGVLVGLLFLIIAQLDTRWFFLLFLGGLIFAASLFAVDKKVFYLAMLVLAIPIGIDLNLYFQPSTFRRSTWGFLIRLSYIPLLALYLIWGFGCVAGRLPFRVSTKGLLPLSALFASGLISVLLGQNRLFGAFDLFAFATSILLFVYVASEIREPQDVRVVLFALMVSMALQGAIAIGQHVTGSALGLEFFGAYRESGQRVEGYLGLAGLTRVGGTFGHPNSLALFFDLLLPLGFSLLFCPMRRRTKVFLAAAVILGATGLVVTLSRGGLFSVASALAVILLVWWREQIGLVRTILAVVLVSTLLALVVFGTSGPIQKRFFGDTYREAFARLPLIKVALNMIRDRPLFGVGLNSYTEAAREYDNTPERITFSWNAPVHNIFLFIAGETGLMGLACFLLLLFTVMMALLPALRSPDRFLASVGLGLLIGLMAYLAHAQIDYSQWTHGGHLWLILGLAVSIGSLGARPATSSGLESLSDKKLIKATGSSVSLVSTGT